MKNGNHFTWIPALLLAALLSGCGAGSAAETLPSEAPQPSAETSLPDPEEDSQALYELGMSYLNGDGVEQNETLACETFERAVELGSTEAMFQLGWCYLDGRGVEQNDAEAARCIKAAAEQDILLPCWITAG